MNANVDADDVVASPPSAAQERLALALESGRQALFEWWPVEDVLELSPSWYTLYRRTPGSVRKALTDFAALIHPSDRDATLHATMQALHGGAPFQAQFRLFRGDGTSAWVMARGVVTERGADGQARRMLGSHVDITELKTVEERLQLAVDATAQGIIEWWPQEDRLEPTASWLALTGYAHGEVASTARIGELGLVHPDDAAAFADFLHALAAGDDGARRIEARFRLRDGGFRWLLGNGKVAETDGSGRAVRVVGTFIDIDDIKGAFHAVEAERTRLALIIQGTDAAVWEWDLDSGATIVNERWAQHLGYANQAELGPTDLARWRERVHPDDLARVESVLARCITGHQSSYACEYRLRHRDQRWLWVHDSGQVIARDGNGRPLRMAGFYLDISMRIERDRHLKAIAEAVTQISGGDLLHTVVRTAQELAEASHAFVAAVAPTGTQATVLAAAPADSELLGRTLALADSPAAALLGAATCLHTAGVAAEFPSDALLGALGIEGYAGRRLGDDQRCEGIFVLMFTRPPGDLERVRSVLEILAATAAHELERERRAAALRDSEQRYRHIYQTMPVMLCTLDDQGVVRDVNEAWVHASGFPLQQCLGRAVTQFFAPASRADLGGLLESSPRGGTRLHLELVTRHGHILSTSCRLFGSGRIADSALRILALEDVTERIRAEREIERLAFHDPLTALPNRRYLLDRLGPAVAAARRRGGLGALLFIDLDRFKQINDSVGHAVGDAVLIQVGNRLRELTRQEDVVARLGGDEFIVMLADLGPEPRDGRARAERVARKITAELARPYTVASQEFHITPTIGIVLFPEQSDDADQILKAADAAMYEGKTAGRNTYRFYHASLAQAASERLALQTELHAALERDQFELYFQPQIDLDYGVVGAEALIRWRHPERGMVPPDSFIPLAEESNLIERIGEWVIARGLEVLAGWLADGMDFIDHLSLNVSSRQFRAADFVPALEAARARAAVPARYVVLEITERTVIDDIEGVSGKMAELRRLGFRFSIDDFGIGYSSLAYLSRLPLDQLKVDRSFVRDVVADVNAGIIAETIISLGRQLGLETIAEGVESEAQREFLAARGNRGFQGNLFCPAVSEAEFRAFCADRGRG